MSETSSGGVTYLGRPYLPSFPDYPQTVQIIMLLVVRPPRDSTFAPALPATSGALFASKHFDYPPNML
jgi:hypothetical protein